jgi:hypothetical protein
MIGRLRRKLKTAAPSRENASPRPAVIVLPERDTPGIIANICATPMMSASFSVMLSSARSDLAKRSTAQSTIPMRMIMTPISAGFLKMVFAYSWSR